MENRFICCQIIAWNCHSFLIVFNASPPKTASGLSGKQIELFQINFKVMFSNTKSLKIARKIG